MRILVTGSNGFIGKNLLVRLKELENFSLIEWGRSDLPENLASKVVGADAVIHLAGENRPTDPGDFAKVNTGLTELLCQAIQQSNRQIPLILASSIQAERDNPYGRSKLGAEQAVQRLAEKTGNTVHVYRLPGVFGKWCRPNYNSVVATFCHNIANGLPIRIDDASAQLRLIYVDDVVSEFILALGTAENGLHWREVQPEYTISLGELADQIRAFGNCRTNLVTEPVGAGLVRALYSTYVSYLPPDSFVYDLPRYSDERGTFVEMLKTRDSGQFSFFTAHPGVTRGSHYHHSKTEKFLVIRGKARFRFRHIITNEQHELFTSGEEPQIVDTIPGWVHDITNVGDEEMVVMLWANEIFDRAQPDTIACKV